MNTKMEHFKYTIIVVVITMSLYCAGAAMIVERFKRDATDSNLQAIFDILKTQDEKINRLQTLVVTSQFLPKCTAAVKSENLVMATKCWKDMIDEIKISDPSVTAEIKALIQLVTGAYDGEKARLPKVAQFIKDNVEKGSALATGAYKALLNAMEYYGDLYLKKVTTDNGLGSGLIDYTYRTLIQIREAEGEASPLFTQKLPSVVNSILTGKLVFIRNSVTKDFLIAPTYSRDNVTKVLLTSSNTNDPRFIWKLTPVEPRWKEYNQESFHIVNTFQNKILAVGDGALTLADATEEKLKSTWAMFYIRLVQGSSGEEVAIQCSYWGIKTLAIEEVSGVKTPKLLKSKTLEEIPTGVWLLQPKV